MGGCQEREESSEPFCHHFGTISPYMPTAHFLVSRLVCACRIVTVTVTVTEE
jgi:hypothetical protein